MNLLYILLVLLLMTRFCGEIAERLKLPALVGELIAGIALGVILHQYSATLPVLADLPKNEVFKGLTDLSIFFLMLLAGVEMHPRDLVKTSGPAVAVAAGGIFIPLLLGFGLGWHFLPETSYKFAQALFLGTALAITAVPVSVKILMDLNLLKTKLGQTIVSAALFDDIFSLILLAVLTAVIKTGEVPGMAHMLILFAKIAGFFVITTIIGHFILPYLGRVVERFKVDEFEFSALLMVALIFALLAELLGMHFIIGAFLAGLFFVRRAIKDEIYNSIRSSLTSWTVGLFAPLFFASIGLHLDLAAFSVIPGFVVLLITAAFFGKLIGAGLPAFTLGFTARQAMGIGTAMSARGAVELIVAGIAMEAGLFSHPAPPPPIIEYMFSAVVIMALLTTFITPILIRPLLGSTMGDDEKKGRG
ncbi:MAG: cation:proton antiporter [Desulforhopalus sp.]